MCFPRKWRPTILLRNHCCEPVHVTWNLESISVDNLKVQLVLQHKELSSLVCVLWCATLLSMLILDFSISCLVRGSLLSPCRKEEEGEICEGHLREARKSWGSQNLKEIPAILTLRKTITKPKISKEGAGELEYHDAHTPHPVERPSQLILTFAIIPTSSVSWFPCSQQNSGFPLRSSLHR